ncbi:hypothetical protein CROQUDRAFT_672664 [Cronartium quercuum f. sp. fusiforme G11]|uniref:Uncharacterized protein n=1 Tax=Cronartium quercuum f. sp. fusiforme G11 TaxID=708437 RepID=A0A9P6NH40_9BASI|nr:hypothetical protein CROQUDRAFT_672664 [Cronartium quercuum f. sp. fusiforme G11]
MSSATEPTKIGSVSRRPRIHKPSLDFLLAIDEAENDQTTAAAEDDYISEEDQLVLTPTRLQRISRALDRIVDDHLASSAIAHTSSFTSGIQDAPLECIRSSLILPSSSFTEPPARESAEERVHEEILKALSVISTTSPSSLATESGSETGPGPWSSSIELDPSSTGNRPRRTSHQSSAPSLVSPSSLLSSSSGPSTEDLPALGFYSTLPASFLVNSTTRNVKTPLMFNADQPLLDTNLRYIDLTAIQQTLVDSAPVFLTDHHPTSWARAARHPLRSPDAFLYRHPSTSTASHVSAQPQPPLSSSTRPGRDHLAKLSPGIGSCERMRSKVVSPERSPPTSSDPAASVDVNLPLPGLGSPTPSSIFSPELHAFPLTPLPDQAVELAGLTRSPSCTDDLLEKPVRGERASPLANVEEEDRTSHADEYLVTRELDSRPPGRWGEARPRAVPGRANKPLPTTMLFRDVEAQAVAANEALRMASEAEGERKKQRKKKSIVRAHIGAPTLVSASANLASISIEAAAPEVILDTDEKKTGSVRNSFKLRLRKKKTQEVSDLPPPPVPSSLVRDPALADQSRAALSPSPRVEEKNRMSDGSPAWRGSASAGMGPIPACSSASSQHPPASRVPEEAERREEEQGAHLDGTLKKSIRRLLSSRSQAKLVAAVPENVRTREERIMEQEDEHSSNQGSSSGWVKVQADEFDSVAPLKIMKGGGGSQRASKRPRDEQKVVVEDTGEVDVSARTELRPPQFIGHVHEDLRPSSDSVQRLLTDLGFPGARTEVISGSERLSPAGQISSQLVSRWSSEARAREDDRRTQWSHSTDSPHRVDCSQSGSESSRLKGRGCAREEDGEWERKSGPEVVVDSVPAQMGAGEEVRTVASESSLDPSLHRHSHASSLQIPSGMKEADADEGDRSDYAASILDLYDRPESSISHDCEGAEAVEPVKKCDGVEPMEVRERGRGTGESSSDRPLFLDIEPSPTDRLRRQSKAGTRESRKSGAGGDDEVMVMMNQFRQELTNTRVSTASALLDSVASVYRSSRRPSAKEQSPGTRRKTVVAGEEDEEDEERVWKIILGR